MIKISGMPFQLESSWNLGSLERMIIQQMNNTRVLYSYPSVRELLFEINVRKNIIESAKELHESNAAFSTFKNASCNDKYWYLTTQGGFLLKPDVSPSAAITDIFRNSSLYGFECATACVIIFYYAILKSIGKSLFDNLFQNLYLYSWHTDPDLAIYTFYATHYLPGDVVYFNNPDFNPKLPWYRGVNAVVMNNDEFFGHGFGIKTDKQMIQQLNKMRKTESNQEAYLTSLVTQPTFNNIAKFINFRTGYITLKKQPIVMHHNKCSISYIQYQYFFYKMILK